MFSCSKKDKKSLEKVAELENNDKAIEEERIIGLMEEYKKISNKKEVDLGEITDFINENIDHVGVENADILIYSLEDKLNEKADKNLKSLVDKDKDGDLARILNGKMFLGEEELKELKNKDLKAEIEDLYNLNYKIFREDENLKLIIDYSKFLNFTGKISEDLDEYLNIKSKLINIPTVYEDRLNISYKDLENRLLKIEDYIVHYPESKRYEDILRAYRENLVDYLKGTNKTPIVNQEGLLDKEALTSYRELAKNKESITAQLIRKYLTNLKPDENFEVRILSLVNEALSTIEDRVNS